MSLRCRVCGRENVDGAQFCANPDCGEYLGWESQRPSGPAGGDPSGRDQRVGVRATLADSVVAVTPGSTATTTLSVYNAGTQVEGLRIRLSGPAAAWTAVEPVELSVFPEQTGTVTLRFAPPRASSSLAGHAWYQVWLDSTVHPGLTVTANGAANVAPYHDVAAELVPPSASGRGATKHQLVVDNRGNVVERAQLSATDDEGAFRMELEHSAAELPPGRVGVRLTVRAPRRWFGRPRSVPIHATVAVEGASAPLRVDGTRHVVPMFPPWVPVAALVTALVLGGGGAAIALTSGSQRPQDQVAQSSTPAPPETTGPPPTVDSPTPSRTPESPSPSPSRTPSSPPASTTAPPPVVDPLDKIAPADCLPYDQTKLKIYDAGAIGWRLVETLAGGQEHWMLILDNQADATAALAVARRSTSFCFIGRSNSRPQRNDYIVEYWKGKSGQTPTIPSPDCIPYNKNGLKTVNEGATGWLLTDGSSRMLILDTEQDAKNALILAQANSKQCFIGRSNSRSNRKDYIVDYWLP